jgi:leucyl/phenylalanyl-tRNA--protein transferase
MPSPIPLTPQVLVMAYSQGIFPMARGAGGPIDWYSPDPRAILPIHPPEAFHLPHGLRRRLKKNPFHLTTDRAFDRVIAGCAAPRDTDSLPWISPEIVTAYTQLHHAGLAHSVEAWLPNTPPTSRDREGAVPPPATEDGDPMQLAGGLYGVALGGVFFGESMFSHASDASKVCLVHLVEHLRARGYALLDTQIINPHLRQFGALEIPRREYLRLLKQALSLPVSW